MASTRADAPAAPSRAAVYVRQSKAREDESQGSPQAQDRAGRAFIVSRGWEHVGTWSDIGVSGYDPKAERVGLRDLLAAVHRGEIDVVVVYRLDRLTRRGVVEAVRLVGELNDHGAALSSVSEPFLDTSTPMGRGIFALFAAMAEQESENIRTRTTSTKALLRGAGSYSGGRRPFGLEPYRAHRDGLSLVLLRPHPTEGPVLADIVERVLAGSTAYAEAQRLNAAGALTPSGKLWRVPTLDRILRSPIIAGYDESRRDPDTGELARPWEGPVAPDTFRRLQAALSARSPGHRAAGSANLLGAWLVRCALCGAGMSGAGGNSRSAPPTYRCGKATHGSGCPGAVVAIRHLDAYVVGETWARAAALDPADPDDLPLLRAVAARFNDAHEDPEAAEARANTLAVIADAEAALLQLDDDRAAGVFAGASGTERYRRQAAALSARADTARSALSALPAPRRADDVWPLLDALADIRAGAAWDAPDSPWSQWSMAERREFLGLFLDGVLVGRSRSRGVFDTGRLRLVWAADQAARQPA